MRLLLLVCVLVCSRFSCGADTNYVECNTLEIPFLQDPQVCVNTTLLDCANVLVRVTMDFDNDQIADWDSGEFQVAENVEVCYTIPYGDPQCIVCARFKDVDATGDGATFDPFVVFSGGPRLTDGTPGVCDILGEISLNQVQVGSDCNDNLLKSSCFLHESCGWCEATSTCESIDAEDGTKPHCADCPSGWEVAPFTNGGSGAPNTNGGTTTDNSGSTSNALAYGLGIGIPLLLVFVGCGFLLYRRNKAIGTSGYDFERHSDENSRSDVRGTTILIPEEGN